MAVDPSGRYVYVANAIGSIEQFAIGPGGALTAMNPASVPAGTLPQAITVDPTGRYVYVANGGYVPNGSGGAISQFGIGPGGELSALNPPTVGTGNDPISVAVDPSGRYVYAAASSDGTLWQYSIGIDGALSVVNPGNAQAGGDPQSVTVDLSGLYIYAADDNGLVAQFSLGASGTLGTSSATSTALAGAQAVATAY
jgi:DNA-binding beta-propeller fold protein YncE